jgi:hypothetical protein
MATTAANTEKTARKGVQVHATLAPEKFDALEDHRWTVRLNMVDLVKLALDEYAANHKVPNYTTDSDAGSKEAPKSAA